MTNAERFEHSFGIIVSVADQLNQIALTEPIPRDRTDIWDVIHNLTDEEWEYLWQGLDWLNHQGAFTDSDDREIATAYKKWKRAHMRGDMWVGHPYDIDPVTGKKKKSGHKHEIWAVWMRMREIVNRYNCVNIPNGPQRTQVKLSNEFHTLFE